MFKFFGKKCDHFHILSKKCTESTCNGFTSSEQFVEGEILFDLSYTWVL